MIKTDDTWLTCLTLACVIYAVSGSANSTLSCAEYGELGKSHTITCDIEGAVSNGITWKRPDNLAVAACNTQQTTCMPESGYNITISGNQYQLYIQSLKKVDAGGWKCRDGADGVMKKGCNLTISSPVSDLACNISRSGSSILIFDLAPYFCSAASRFELHSGTDGRLCNVIAPSNTGNESRIVNGTCEIPSDWSGTVKPVMTCGSVSFNLTCSLSIGGLVNGGVFNMTGTWRGIFVEALVFLMLWVL